jgi:lipooligosaccharide transport system permease protein
MNAAFALRSFEFWLLNYKRTWRGTAISSVVNPVFYLSALGIGLGTLVNRAHSTPGGVSYVAFVAPGVLAATAMQIGTFEAAWPVLGSIKWTRNYHAMLATPLGIRDIVLGHQLWIAARVVSSSAVYLAVIAAFGGIHSWLAPLALPVCFLVGLAFSGAMSAYSSTRETDNAFAVVFRFGIVPMFLFSGTFFPISRLHVPLREIAYATPLYHGVALCRGLTLGTIHWPAALGHTAYLVAFAVAGLVLAEHFYARRLVT